MGLTVKPPYQVTKRILALVAEISEKIGEINAAKLDRPSAKLRRSNRIKTIQSSLAIEGNQLTEAQITDLLENKRVLAPRKDILEVKNAIELYDRLGEFDAFSSASLLAAHGILMRGLVESPGRFRTEQVGILKGKELGHLAPPGLRVHGLIEDLFGYLQNDDDLLLIKSFVFHYEFEFIHPFLDGNGRLGRFWQTMILRKYAAVFEYLPVEALVRDQQALYYGALEHSDQQGDSTPFVEFMLGVLNQALGDVLRSQRVTLTGSDRLDRFRERIGEATFTRQDYLRANKQISPATASRDLRLAVEQGLVERQGDKRTAVYRFKG
jgi:Fic family protein